MAALKFEVAVPQKFSCPDWQRTDLEALAELDHSANWSTMGCYKTSTGAWLIEKKLTEWPTCNVLVVTTKSGKGPWFDALPRCLDIDEWRIYNLGRNKVEEVLLDDLRLEIDFDDFVRNLMEKKHRSIVISHYQNFENRSPLTDLFVEGVNTDKLEWDFIVLDEAHRTKNKDAQWTRNIKKFAKKTPFKHVMTGTGFVNNPAEIWSLINFLDREKFPSFDRFKRKFCEIDDYSGYEKIVGIVPWEVDNFREMRRSYGPRRTMQEVHSDIGEPIYHSVDVELNATQRRMYKETVAELRMLDQKGMPIHAPNVVAMLQRLRQISVATPELIDEGWDFTKQRHVQHVKLVEPSSKLDALMEIIEGLEWDKETRQQVVVFSNFKDPLELLKKRLDPQYIMRNGRPVLRREGIPYIHMEQKDSEATRFEKWRELWPQKKHQVFMCTTDLGGESINLSSAQYAVFLDRSWSPAKNLQAVGRIYRPGQTGIAEIIHINATQTVDKKVMEAVDRKVGWFNILFSDEEEE